MYNFISGQIEGLPEYELNRFKQLEEVYHWHKANNEKKDKYYEGNVSLNDVNLGIAIPIGFRNLEIACSWGAKTVDVLAQRSMFDGFVGSNGQTLEQLEAMIDENDLISEYSKACRDELKYGCTFATLTPDDEIGCKIRFHSPQSAAALWDGEKGRISCGFAIIDTVPDEMEQKWTPTLINFYTDTDIWVLRKDVNIWIAERHPQKLGRPMIEALIWNATTDKPFGRSRIKEPIRRLIDGYVRTLANATIGLEFATSPQKYLLGASEEQVKKIGANKFNQYVGSILASTNNPEDGEKPSFGQLAQGNISPHVEMIRILATQFSAATGLSVTDTGVVNDANPTSSDAILAQSQTLIGMAEQLNIGNGNALRNIAMMMLAVANNTGLDGLTDEQKDIIAHFKNPAMPSVAMTTDAAIKIVSARPEFASTDVFLEMIGFDQAEIRRIRAQETRARGSEVLMEFSNEESDEEGLVNVQKQIGGDQPEGS